VNHRCWRSNPKDYGHEIRAVTLAAAGHRNAASIVRRNSKKLARDSIASYGSRISSVHSIL
jgi:hypothetical protein